MGQTACILKLICALFSTQWKTGSLGTIFILYLSHVVRKPHFCLCENKGADQLRSNSEAVQRSCFRYLECTIPLLL